MLVKLITAIAVVLALASSSPANAASKSAQHANAKQSPAMEKVHHDPCMRAAYERYAAHHKTVKERNQYADRLAREGCPKEHHVAHHAPPHAAAAHHATPRHATSHAAAALHETPHHETPHHETSHAAAATHHETAHHETAAHETEHHHATESSPPASPHAGRGDRYDDAAGDEHRHAGGDEYQPEHRVHADRAARRARDERSPVHAQEPPADEGYEVRSPLLDLFRR